MNIPEGKRKKRKKKKKKKKKKVNKIVSGNTGLKLGQTRVVCPSPPNRKKL